MNKSLVDMDDMLGTTTTVTRGKNNRTKRQAKPNAPSLSTYGAARPNLQGMNQGMGMMPPQGRGMGNMGMQPGMNMGFNQYQQQQRSPQMGFGQMGMGGFPPQQQQMPMGRGFQQNSQNQANPFGNMGTFT